MASDSVAIAHYAFTLYGFYIIIISILYHYYNATN